MEKRFQFNFALVTAVHIALILMVIFLGHFLMSKPKQTEKVAWINPGILTAMGQQGIAEQQPTPPAPAPPVPEPPKPTPPPPSPPQPTLPPPQPQPPTPPPPQTTAPPPKPAPKAPTPAPPKKDIPVKSTAKGNLNVTQTPPQATPKKPEPPKPPTPVPSKQAPPKKPTPPVITKSDKVVTRPSTTSTPSKQEPSPKPATSTAASSASQASASQAKSDALESLQQIAQSVSSGATKSGLTTSMTIGTYGVSGGQESDFSAYFNHIRSRMIDSWDRPRDLLGPSQKLKTGIRMKISRNGNVSSVSLASSSGNSTWDESALAAARKVTKVNPLPDGLGDDSGLTLTVFFEPEG